MSSIITKRKKGMTLIEVVISLAILGVIIVPLGSMVLTSVRTNKAGEDKQQATAIAQQIIEEIKVNNTPSPTDNTIKIMNNAVLLNQMAVIDPGYEKGYSVSGADVSDGFKANVKFQKNKSYETDTETTTPDSAYDVIIELVSEGEIKVTGKRLSDGAALVSSPYVSYTRKLNEIYVKEDRDNGIINIYNFDGEKYTTVDSTDLIFSIKKKSINGKVKIIYSNTLDNSNIKVSSTNNTSSDVLGVYCYKNNDDTDINIVNNLAGMVNIYEALQQVTADSNQRGVYDVSVVISKNYMGSWEEVYEAEASITVND